MLWTAMLPLLWVLAGAGPLDRRGDRVTEGDDDAQPSTADVIPIDWSTPTGQPEESISISVAASSLALPPLTQQQSPALSLTDLNTAGTVTATSTVHTGTTSTTTFSSVLTSTFTVLSTLTNFVTTVITTKKDIATSTRHVTVTMTLQPAERRYPALAMGREQVILTTPSPARSRHQGVPATTTRTLVEVGISIATRTTLIPSVETVTLVDTANVPVTSWVYDGAITTVTLNLTHTVTTTTPFTPSTPSATVISTTPSSPEPTTILPPPPDPSAPGLPLKTKAAIGGSVATLMSLLVIAIAVYRHYHKKQLAKQDTSPSALAAQHHNNHGSGPFNPGNAAGHHANLDSGEPTVSNMRPDPAVLGTARTGVLTKKNIPGSRPVVETPVTEKTAGPSRSPMVGPRQSPRQSRQRHSQTRVKHDEEPEPSDDKVKGTASLWEGGKVPSYSRFKKHMEEIDTVFGSCPRPGRPAHLQGLPVTDNTGRFAPGAGEYGRYSAHEWTLDPVRQELEGDKDKQAWELPADEDLSGKRVDNETAESV